MPIHKPPYGTLTAIESEVESEVGHAVTFAEASPEPELSAALADVYADA